MNPEKEAPLIEHLIELRSRLLWALGGVLAVFLALAPFSSRIYSWIAAPLLRTLPGQGQMIATQVVSPFVAPMKLTLVIAVALTVPWWLYQAWRFIAPALYTHEKSLFRFILVSSTFFFFLGMAFAYEVVFPTVFAFLAKAAPAGVTMMTDINAYLDFIFAMFLAFGLAFEVPVAVVFLVRAGIVEARTLARLRPYMVIGAFVVAAILTPPDLISQFLLAIPLIVLFEAGLFFARRFEKKEHAAVVRDHP